MDKYEPLPEQARRIAQEALDRMDSGVQIAQLSLSTKFAPRQVIADFNSVSQAEQGAQQAIAAAQMERESKLTSTAGGAAEPILTQIEQYELDLAARDDDAAEQTYARIKALLSGEPVTINGAESSYPLSGEVVRVVQEAEQFRSQVVADAQTSASIFQAKLAAFTANPAVMIHTDWANAMASLLSNPKVQTMLMDTHGPMTYTINRDPEVKRQLERERNAERKREAMDQRQREMELQRYERETGGTVSEQ
jgi:hypothetical protein